SCGTPAAVARRRFSPRPAAAVAVTAADRPYPHLRRPARGCKPVTAPWRACSTQLPAPFELVTGLAEEAADQHEFAHEPAQRLHRLQRQTPLVVQQRDVRGETGVGLAANTLQAACQLGVQFM